MIGQLGIGGSERQLYLFLSVCDRLRWEPVVFTAGGEGQWADAIRDIGIRVERLRGGRLRKLLALRRQCQQLDVDVLLSWSSFTNAYAWCLVGLGVPAVGSYRNALFADLRPRLQRVWASLGAARLRLLVANSAETAASLSAWCDREVMLVPNAVEAPAAPADARVTWRRRLGYADSDLLVMGMGRMSPQKNFGRFIDTVARAAPTVPSLRALIMGPDYEGFRADLEDYARRVLPPGVLAFADAVPSGAEAICAADVLLLTSDYEGMPNVVLEAMAAGVPCVTTRVNGVNAAIDDGYDGCIVAPDAAALAHAVVALARDDEKRQRMGARARRSIAGNRTPEVVYAPLWKALDLCAATRPAGAAAPTPRPTAVTATSPAGSASPPAPWSNRIEDS